MVERGRQGLQHADGLGRVQIRNRQRSFQRKHRFVDAAEPQQSATALLLPPGRVRSRIHSLQLG